MDHFRRGNFSGPLAELKPVERPGLVVEGRRVDYPLDRPQRDRHPVLARLAEFVDYYNTQRYHEGLGNLTPADIYFNRGPTILARRQSIKHQIIELRRAAASTGRRLNP